MPSRPDVEINPTQHAFTALRLRGDLASLFRLKFVYRPTPHGIIQTITGREILHQLSDGVEDPTTDQFAEACKVLTMNVMDHKNTESGGYWNRVE